MEMPKPGMEHQKMSYFLGKWHSTGTLKPGPWGPGGAMSGDDTCSLMPGGFFVVCNSEGSGPLGKMNGLGVMGYDAEKKVYTWNGFNNMGENEKAAGNRQREGLDLPRRELDGRQEAPDSLYDDGGLSFELRLQGRELGERHDLDDDHGGPRHEDGLSGGEAVTGA